MMKPIRLSAAVALVSLGLLAGGQSALAAEGAAIPHRDWTFSGPFGSYDRAQLQRGFQVYREVCAGCHSVRLIAFRNLADLGYDEEEIKAFAAETTVIDGPDDEGEMFERAGLPADRLPLPFPNTKAAAAANNGAVPPDLTLMAKARKGGPDYIHALLIGYEEEPPEDVEMMEGLNYNKYFPGGQIAMAPPLFEEAVEYADGTEASLEQMASDVTAFLMWTAEPKMERRKEIGLKTLIFLVILTALFYAAKRKVWADLH
jgi:ubiquinol-cytochrome c reductase cytochrome c1 subunit